MIVAKFGGTSVGDPEAIQRLIGIVAARRAEQPLVVVSALSKVTDALLDLARPIAAGDEAGVLRALEALDQRHASVASALPGAERAMEPIRDDLAAIRQQALGSLGQALAPRHLDALAGFGELWSSLIVTMAMQGAGLPAVWCDVRPVMRTDDRFTRATPLTEHLPERARAEFGPLLEAGKIPVTQGFLGSTLDGIPTTLGRGGSDFTASLLGAALDAERVEIWTDVDGLMTADPRIVPSARTLPQATYEEAAELATFGAKVLHPATQLPLAERGIPFTILNSRRPENGGTVIAPDVDHRGLSTPIRSISWKKGIIVINVRAPRMLGAYGFLRALFEVFERHEVVVDVLASGEVSVSLTIEDGSKLDLLRRELSELGEVTIFERRAIIAVVGVGLRDTPGLGARIFAAVRPANVELISQGASAINMTFIVREEEAPDAVRRLHREFFGTD
ncbi:MAG: lysine-sensitive aspartokinase 3 [Gemmatimonadota bacterium]